MTTNLEHGRPPTRHRRYIGDRETVHGECNDRLIAAISNRQTAVRHRGQWGTRAAQPPQPAAVGDDDTSIRAQRTPTCATVM